MKYRYFVEIIDDSNNLHLFMCSSLDECIEYVNIYAVNGQPDKYTIFKGEVI